MPRWPADHMYHPSMRWRSIQECGIFSTSLGKTWGWWGHGWRSATHTGHWSCGDWLHQRHSCGRLACGCQYGGRFCQTWSWRTCENKGIHVAYVLEYAVYLLMIQVLQVMMELSSDMQVIHQTGLYYHILQHVMCFYLFFFFFPSFFYARKLPRQIFYFLFF